MVDAIKWWFRTTRCDTCGRVLLRRGHMTGTPFVLSARADGGSILCEVCARLAGVWGEDA